MEGLERIFKLSKKLALSIINGDKEALMDLKSELNKNDQDYIIKNLTDKKIGERRRELRKELDRAKALQYRKMTGTRRRRIRFGAIQKVAAVFIGILGLSYFFYVKSVAIPNEKESLKSDVISLRLEDGSIMEIDPDESTGVIDPYGNIIVKQRPGALKYDQNKDLNELSYNELYVPYGKRYSVILSDGTLVNLNSGSTLKYPVNFIQGTPREVFLKGEAFFSVAKDSLNSFSVFTGELGVKVLGTKFNISSYPEDLDISTVLSEGSVQLYEVKDPMKGSLLTPGHMASWNREGKSISISEVDVSLYTGWIEGELVFKSMSFERIVEKLERSYNVEIINNDEKLNKEIFTASFHVDLESIEQLLDYIKLERPFTYTINNNKIIINP